MGCRQRPPPPKSPKNRLFMAFYDRILAETRKILKELMFPQPAVYENCLFPWFWQFFNTNLAKKAGVSCFFLGIFGVFCYFLALWVISDSQCSPSAMMAPPCCTTVIAKEVVIVNIAGGGPVVTVMGHLNGTSIDIFRTGP